MSLTSLKSLIVLKLLLFFLAGLLFSFYVNINLPKYFYIATLIIAVVFILGLNQFKFSYQQRYISGAVISLLLFLLGLTRMGVQQEQFAPPTTQTAAKSVFVIKVEKDGIQKANSTMYNATIEEHQTEEFTNKKLIVYVSKDIEHTYQKGDKLFVNSYINRIAAPLNPHSFNYQHFMNKRGIYYQVYLPKDAILEVEPAKEQRENIIAQLKNICFDFITEQVAPKQQAIAKALLIGYKEELSQEVSDSFQNSGTMHILAVSGLHVGIIYLLLLQLLKFTKKIIRLPKPVVIAILLIGIWVFALLTGAKASVLRAATMFSLFAIGKELYPSTNSVNILSVTAFGMLLINPFYLYDVGFQLSFSAVFGILMIMPLLRGLRTGNKIIDYIIDITAVSFAAQIATLPFSMLYFHIYPTYSLLANLLAIPLATSIVSVGFMGVLLSKIPFVATILGSILTKLIQLLQWNNNFFSALDFAVIDNIYLTPLQVVLLLIAIYFVVFHFKLYKNKLLFVGLCSFLLLMSLITMKKYKAMQTNKMFVYAINQHLVLDEHKGRHSTLYLQQDLPENTYTFNIANNHRANYIKDTTHQRIDNDLLVFGKQSVQLVNNETKRFYPVDVYIITEPTNTLLQQKYLQDKKVIIANRRKPNYLELPNHFHFLQDDGYYEF